MGLPDPQAALANNFESMFINHASYEAAVVSSRFKYLHPLIPAPLVLNKADSYNCPPADPLSYRQSRLP